jgi:hypothetical protein
MVVISKIFSMKKGLVVLASKPLVLFPFEDYSLRKFVVVSCLGVVIVP